MNDNSKMVSNIENSTNANSKDINELLMAGSDMSFISTSGGGGGGSGGGGANSSDTTIGCDDSGNNQKLINIKNHEVPDEKQINHDQSIKLKMMMMATKQQQQHDNKDVMIANKNNNNNNGSNNNSNNKNNTNLNSQHLIPIKNLKHKIPKNILMGSVQLILSIVLVALGCLVLAREAALANAGSGLWAGAICAIAGSLGIINIQRAQTAFLAVSLVCVASSTLAIAITGIGVVRDSYTTVTDKTTSAVTAGAGLVFILTVHFFVSVFSVYHQTLKLCTRQMVSDDDGDDAIAIGSHTMLTQKKVEEYIKSLTQQQKQGIYNNATIISNEKFINFPYKTIDKRSANGMSPGSGIDNLSNFTYPGIGPYPVMLVPATGNTKQIQMMPIFPPPQFLPMQPMVPPPYMPADMGYPDMKFYDRMRTSKPSKKHQNKERRGGGTKKRRRSEGDILNNNNKNNMNAINNREALVYTGLDRTIADDFLAQQEKCNNSLQIQYDDATKECYDSKRDIAL